MRPSDFLLPFVLGAVAYYAAASILVQLCVYYGAHSEETL
jgi:hypothetical protein